MTTFGFQTRLIALKVDLKPRYFDEIFARGDLEEIRAYLASDLYARESFLGKNELYINEPSLAFDHDLFLHFAMPLVRDTVDPEFIIAGLDLFMRQANITTSPQKLLRIFTRLFARNDLLMYAVIASYISHRGTWRAMFDIAKALVDDDSETTAVGLFTCWKFGGVYFTSSEKNFMERRIRNLFDVNNIDEEIGRSQFIVYLTKTGTPTEPPEQDIAVADSHPMLDDYIAGFHPSEYDQVLSLADMNPFVFIERELELGDSEREFDPPETKEERERRHHFVELLTKRHRRAAKILCRRELISQMLAMSSIDISMYLNYEIAAFSIDCVRDNVLTQYDAMRVIERVKRARHNAIVRAESEIASKK